MRRVEGSIPVGCDPMQAIYQFYVSWNQFESRRHESRVRVRVRVTVRVSVRVRFRVRFRVRAGV